MSNNDPSHSTPGRLTLGVAQRDLPESNRGAARTTKTGRSSVGNGDATTSRAGIVRDVRRFAPAAP